MEIKVSKRVDREGGCRKRDTKEEREYRTFQLFFTEPTPPGSLLASATAAALDADVDLRDDLFLLPMPESNCSGGEACSFSSLLGFIMARGIFSGGKVSSSFPTASLPLVFLLLLSPFLSFLLLASSAPSAAAARSLTLRHEEDGRRKL